MVKVGLVGCGGIAHAHGAGWKDVAAAEGGQVAALCDVSDENMDRLEEALGLSGTPRFHDWGEMLDAVELDAIDICLPHHLHAPAILAAAEHKAAVLCEKPLCMNFDEAAQITQAVEASGITLMCAHNQLFFPAVRRMRELLDDGAVGKPWWFFSADCFRTERTREQWGWRADLETAGGGVLIDTGYHPSYRLLYLAASEPAAVTSMMENYHAPIEGEDLAQVLVKFASGAMGQILTSWAIPMWPGSWQVMAYGDEGALYGRGSTFVHKPINGEAREEKLDEVNGFAAEVVHFVDCLENGKTPIQTHVDGINVLKLILGAYQAKQSGQTVTF